MKSHQLSHKKIDEIQNWLIGKIASLTCAPACEIDADFPLSAFGLNSIQLTELIHDLQIWLCIETRLTITWDCSTIKTLARYLYSKIYGGFSFR